MGEGAASFDQSWESDFCKRGCGVRTEGVSIVIVELMRERKRKPRDEKTEVQQKVCAVGCSSKNTQRHLHGTLRRKTNGALTVVARASLVRSKCQSK